MYCKNFHEISLTPLFWISFCIYWTVNCAGSTATEIDDRLSPGNVTLLSGETALLACKIYNLGNKSVGVMYPMLQSFIIIYHLSILWLFYPYPFIETFSPIPTTNLLTSFQSSFINIKLNLKFKIDKWQWETEKLVFNI